MLPAFAPGRLILARSWFWRLKLGNVVVVRHQGLEKIKRVQQIDGDKVFLTGDNPVASTDSRQFGWVDRKQVIARVVL